MKYALEKSKYFPYIVWSVVIIFILFLYTVITELRAQTTHLEAQATKNEQTIDALLNAKPDTHVEIPR